MLSVEKRDYWHYIWLKRASQEQKYRNQPKNWFRIGCYIVSSVGKVLFKHIFKTTSEYADILKEIEIILNKQLFPITEKKNVSFEDTKLMGIFDNPATFDFNDRYYARSFPGEDVYFVTNDADFNNITGINIITANQKMLDGVCE